MKFLYVHLKYAPHWNQPQAWKRIGCTWYKCWPFVLFVSWADLETAKMWDL